MQDFFAAKRERYDRIFLQLPEVLRRFNHHMIKKASGFSKLNIILFISFFLGMIISLGEFLCTGQIYLATIITIFQTDSQLSNQVLLLLILYNLGLVLPLIILTLTVYKGREIFEVPGAIRERLHIIKIINALIFFCSVLLYFYFFNAWKIMEV
jgi:cytochrome c biogenesis protein CcdA